jgi:anti-sigma B factor antagonist
MKISTSVAGDDIVVLEVQGDVDAFTARELERALGELLAQGHWRLAVDASQIGFISSAGLRAVLFAHRETLDHGGEVRLFGPSEAVRRVFEMAGFDEYLRISNTRQEAMQGW